MGNKTSIYKFWLEIVELFREDNIRNEQGSRMAKTDILINQKTVGISTSFTSKYWQN